MRVLLMFAKSGDCLKIEVSLGWKMVAGVGLHSNLNIGYYGVYRVYMILKFRLKDKYQTLYLLSVRSLSSRIFDIFVSTS